MDHRDAVLANYSLQRRAYSVNQSRLGIFSTELSVDVPNQMGEHFRVCVRAKVRVTVLNQLLLERLVIFDHAVVNERDLSAGIKMRVRIFIVYLPVGRPTRVTDPEQSWRRVFGN